MFEIDKINRQRKVVSYAVMLDLVTESVSGVNDIRQNIDKNKSQAMIAIHDALCSAIKEKKHGK